MAELKTSLAATGFVNLTPAVLIALSIAALATPPPRSNALVVTFLMSAVALQLSGYITYKTRSYVRKEYIEANEEDNDEENREEDDSRENVSSVEFYNIVEKLMKPSLSTIRIFLPSSLILILTLMIRLFSVDNFGGKPSLLDYGPKISKNGYAGETNIAFEEMNFDTFGHAIQGFLAAFLSYPTIAGLISKMVILIKVSLLQVENSSDGKYPSSLLLVKPSIFTLSLIQLIQVCMTIYPFYSTVKRLRYSSFAQTSHANNTTEWCLGCIFGVAMGCLATALVRRRLVILTETQEERNNVAEALEANEEDVYGVVVKKYGFGKSSDFENSYPSKVLKCIQILCLGVLILFAVTSLFTGLFFGLSWNHDDDDDDEKVSPGMVAIFACLNLVIYVLFFFLSKSGQN